MGFLSSCLFVQMASGVSVVAVVLVAATSCLLAADAQTTSSNSCATQIAGLAPCLNYITGANSSSTPSSSCCSQLSSVVNSNPECLCLVLNGTASSSLGVTINQTRALDLPTACNVQTPSLTTCNASTVGSPLPSPGSPGVTSIAPSPTSSDGNVPATVSFGILFLLLFIGTSSSIFNPVHVVLINV